jgi:hypothetical protein
MFGRVSGGRAGASCGISLAWRDGNVFRVPKFYGEVQEACVIGWKQQQKT